MSSVKIRNALETALNAMSPALSTSFENASFTPPVSTTAYQSATLLLAEPDNTVYGGTFQEMGLMQVDLNYPMQTGAGAAYARAELLRTTFARGESFTSSGTTVTILRTPEILPGRNVDGRYVLPVRIRFFANVTV